MRRFKKILVVYNNVVGDEDALTKATALAKANDAELTIVEIDETPTGRIEASEHEKHLSRVARTIEDEGVKAVPTVLVGTSFLEIIRQVLRNSHDLVILSAEGEVGFRDLFFGGTTMRLMRKCPCPVWVTKPGTHNAIERVLAAVDPHPDDEEVDELNKKIMDLATSLAVSNSSELHVLHAWEFTGNDLDTMQSETTQAIREHLTRKHQQLHERPIERLLGSYDLGDIEHHVHVLEGTPEVLIPKTAAETAVDLVVMGTVARTGIPGLFVGNTAEVVLRQLNCAVLTVKPDGFLTPVTLEVQ
jgi:nucleotide-binding universal stress UspA family protein